MPDGRSWTIRGVSDRTRAAVLEAAQAADLTIWVDRALAKAAEEARHPRPPAATREDVAEVVRAALGAELALLAEHIDRLAAALEALSEAAEAPSPTAAMRARRRRRRGL
jgi:hypothetical protein